MSKHERDTDLILKKNLEVGQVVYYYQKPELTSDGVDYRGKKTTIQKLTFKEFYTGRYNGECTLFLNEKGQKKKFYDSIKGLLYHTELEAQEAFDLEIQKLKLQIVKNAKKQIIKLEKIISIYEPSDREFHLEEVM